MCPRTGKQRQIKPTRTITAQAVITTHIQGRKDYIAPDYSTKSYNYGSGKLFIPALEEESTITTAKAKRLMFPKDE